MASTQPDIHRKVKEDDPNRCQSVMGGKGQCNNAQVPGSLVCMIHGGGQQNNKNIAEAKRNYRLTIYRDRVNAFADNEQVKSLREEIGITRLMLESLMERCPDLEDLLLRSDQISKIVTQITSLVMCCQKLEEKSGSLLDKTQLFVISEAFVKIISDHVTDPDALEVISNKIQQVLITSIATNPLS